MKRLILAIGLVLGLGVSFANAQGTQLCYLNGQGTSCTAGIQTSLSKPIDIATNATTQLVPLDANKTIYVTHFDVMAGGTGNFRLVYGTGTNCGTGQGNLTGAYPLTAQAGLAPGNGTGAILVLPKGNALCAVTDNIQYSGSVSYVQLN